MDMTSVAPTFLKAESADSLGDTTHTEDTGYFPTKMSHDESPIVAKRKEIKDGSPIYVKSSNNSSSRATEDEVLDRSRPDSIVGEYGGGGEDDDGADSVAGHHCGETGYGGRKEMHSPAAMSSLRKKRHHSGESESRDTDSKARRSPPPHIGKRGLPGALKFLLQEEAAAATITTTTASNTTSTTATTTATAPTTGSGVVTRARSSLRADTLTESEMMFDLELEM